MNEGRIQRIAKLFGKGDSAAARLDRLIRAPS